MKVRITKVPDKSLNAKKWKHGDGGFMNNYYDGETESTGLMQRIPNWVVRGQDYSEWKPSDIQEIINWGYTDPYAFFGQEGEATRDALSRAGMADSVIADIYANAPAELQAQLGDRYKGTAQRQAEYDQGIRDYTNYVAPRLGAAMAGSLLGAEGLSVAAPWLVDVAVPAVSRFLATPTGKIMKVEKIVYPNGEVHEKSTWIKNIDDNNLDPDDLIGMDPEIWETLNKDSYPEDAALPWAYGGLLNRMSKFYNNDRSSMLNLVRKVKAGMN